MYGLMRTTKCVPPSATKNALRTPICVPTSTFSHDRPGTVLQPTQEQQKKKKI